MQRAADTSRFLINLSFDRGLADDNIKASRGGLLQRVLLERFSQSANSRRALVDLANNLIRVAEHAYGLRNISTIQEAGEILMGLPIEAARQIGLYYHALAINRKGQTNEAKRSLEKVAEKAPLVYRARAIQTLGGYCINEGQPDEALRFLLKALQAASDKNTQNLLVTLLAHFEISHIRSELGDHQGALDILTSLSPLVRFVSKEKPLYWYVYHNELAVELGELGRIAEAKAACKIAIASPFASAYPEWAETSQELDAKLMSASPSVVSFSRAHEAEITRNPKPKGEINSAKAVAFSWLSQYQRPQKAIAPVGASAAIAKDELPQVVLDRVGKSIQARAPPARP